ncbi:hypothetical protein BJ944DRAFT_271079 [Cunninghamella echinulata]|nr:hypothetical protein BJ944DRAFT_271079 [Cunninghamella echinulata]
MYSISLLFTILYIIHQVYSIPILNEPSLSKQEAIQQEVQSFYENIIDEVISYHSEALLYSLYYDEDIKNNLLKTNNDQHEKCLNNIPHYIGMLLYDKHFETYKNIGMFIEKEIVWKKEKDQHEWSKEIQQTVLYLFKQYMNPTDFMIHVSTLLSTCKNNDNDNNFIDNDPLAFIRQSELSSGFSYVDKIHLYPLEQEIIQFMNDMYDDLKEEMNYRTNDSLYLILSSILQDDSI